MRGLVHRDQSRLPAMWFTDSAGLRWALSHTGKLARVVDRDSQRDAHNQRLREILDRAKVA